MKTKVSHWVTAFIYLSAAAVPATGIVKHSEAQIRYFERVSDINNFSNTSALVAAKFLPEFSKKLGTTHHFIGPLITPFFAGFISRHFHLPKVEAVKRAQNEIPGLARQESAEKGGAEFWSWILLLMSVVYFIAVSLGRGEDRLERALFSLTVVSVVFFLVGIFAPAMEVLVMLPKNPVFPSFVLHHDTRSVLGVISQSYIADHWFIAGCLTLFSVIIPLAKAALTIFSLESAAPRTKVKIEELLSLISKWSMVDVYVAAIILSHFALESDQSTRAFFALGFYYFFGYCLLSMAVTMLLCKKLKREGAFGDV